ncbi:MAG: DegV family protein [Chloroflexi bacterium]|nr:DegV family protein [Chloroflexota bacterium]
MATQSTPPGRPPVIVTDVACDIPSALMTQYNLHVVPLKILFGDETYRSGVDMTPEQFYARLARHDVHPTTSQPTVADFVELYRKLSADGTPILSIHLSEGLSGTVNVARQAAKEITNASITVHDSTTLTGHMGIQVLTAARAAQAGYAIDQIIKLMQNDFQQGDMLFTVDDLSYLHRGGRIGSVRYQIGQVLNIKPVVTVAKTGEKLGTYIPAGRVRSMPKAIDAFIEHMVQQIGAGSKLRAITVYGDDPKLAAQLNAQLAQKFDCVFLEMVPTAPVLGVHVGPSALGIGYAPGDWPV